VQSVDRLVSQCSLTTPLVSRLNKWSESSWPEVPASMPGIGANYYL